MAILNITRSYNHQGTISTTIYNVSFEVVASEKAQYVNQKEQAVKDKKKLEEYHQSFFGISQVYGNEYTKAIAKLGSSMDNGHEWTASRLSSSYAERRNMYKDQQSGFKSVVLSKLASLSEKYGTNPAGTSDDIIPLVHYWVPVGTGLSIEFKAGVVFALDIKATLGIGFVVKHVNENGTITTPDGVEDYTNSHTELNAYIHLKGELHAKVGLGVSVAFSAWCIFVEINAQGGTYVDLEGELVAVIGNAEAYKDIVDMGEGYEMTNWLTGFGHIELGLYGELSFKVGVKFNLGIWELEISHSATVAGKKSPILGAGLATYSDLVSDELAHDNLEDIYSRARDPITKGKEYVPEYVFDDSLRIRLDEYYIRTIDLKNAKVNYQKVEAKDLEYQNAFFVDISEYGWVTPKDRQQEIIDELVTVKIRGNDDPRLTAGISIRRDPVDETGVVLGMDDDNTIESGSQRTVWAAVMPDDASFKNVKFEIYSIVLSSGEVVDTAREIAKYASLDREIGLSTELITTSAIRVGSKIRLRATTEYKEIESEILDIEVVPTRVESLVIVSGGVIVLPDSELNFGINVGPSNATALIDGVKPTAVVDGSTPYGYITGDYNKGFVLHVSDDAPLYSNILINLMIQDGEDLFIQSVNIFVSNEPLLGLAVYSGGSELPASTAIGRGRTLALEIVKIPYNAVDKEIGLYTTADRDYAYIDSNNNLVVTKSAPIGYKFVVNASSDHTQSPAYNFVVEEVAIDSVVLSADTLSSSEPGQQVRLRSEIYPASEAYRTPTYRVVSGDATINRDYVVIQRTASVGSIIVVEAELGGVVSNRIEVQVKTSDIHIATASSEIRAGDSTRLQVYVSPFGSVDISAIDFAIVHGAQYASISDDGLIIVERGIADKGASFGVQARLGGVYSNILTLNIVIPVESVTIRSNAPQDRLQLGQSTNLIADIYPKYASNQDIRYILTSNSAATLSDNILTITNDKAYVGTRVGIIAIVDGVRSEIYYITIDRVFVIDVLFDVETMDVRQGSSATLSAVAYPINATNNDITYMVVGDSNYAKIVGSTVYVSDTAPVDSEIEILAMADDIISSRSLRIIVAEVEVESVTLSVDGELDLQHVLAGSKVQLSTTVLPHNASFKTPSYRLLGDGASYASIDEYGVLTIKDAYSIPKVDGALQILATVQGVESNIISLSIFVPITDITITPKGQIGNDGGYTTVPHATIEFEHTVNSSASHNTITYALVDSEYGKLSGNVLQVGVVDKSGASIRVIAYGIDEYSNSGVYSNEVVLDIYIAVDSIELGASSNNVRVGSSLALSSIINPHYATNASTLQYELVSAQGGYSPISGVRIDGTNLVVDNDDRLIDLTVYVVARVAVDGVSSAILAIEIVPIPVDAIYVDDSITVNPATTAYLAASVNSDASVQELAYSVDTDAIRLESAQGGIRLVVDRYIDFDTTYTLTITTIGLDESGRPLNRAVAIIVEPIYLSKGDIQGVTIIDKGDNYGTVVSDKVQLGQSIGILAVQYTSGLNPTFVDYYIRLQDTPLATINSDNDTITVYTYEDIKTYLTDSRHSITLTMVIDQRGGETIEYRVEIDIYVPIHELEVVGLQDGEVVKIDRVGAKESDYRYAQSTHRYVINGGYYTDDTVPLTSVQYISTGAGKLKRDLPSDNSALSNNNTTYLDNTATSSHQNCSAGSPCASSNFALGARALASARALERSAYPSIVYDERDRVLLLQFNDYYTYGTRFVVLLESMDRSVSFEFTLEIAPLVDKLEIEYTDVKSVTNGSTDISQHSGQSELVLGDGSKTTTYADLMPDQDANIVFGRAGSYGTGLSMSVEKGLSTLKGNYSFNPVDGKVTINPKASNNPDQVLAIRVDYEDGIIQQSEIYYIRVFVPLKEKTEFNAGNHNLYMTDKTFDISKVTAEDPYSKYEFVAVSGTSIDVNGILTLNDPNSSSTSAYTIRQLRQRYNGGYVTVGNNSGYVTLDKSISVYRRYITTSTHLTQLKYVVYDEAREGADGEQSAAYRTYYLRATITFGSSSVSLIERFEGILEGSMGSYNSIVRYTIRRDPIGNSLPIGLIGTLEAKGEVRNVNISADIYVGVDDRSNIAIVGGLVGHNYGIIDNVNIDGNINVNMVRSYVGGIVGINTSGGTVSNSINKARVSSRGDMGGIAGQNFGGTASDNKGIVGCINYGDYYYYYKDLNMSVGGIVGYNKGAIKKSANYARFYLDNKSSSTGYRELPEGRAIAPHVGKMIGYALGYYDGYGNYGSYEGFWYHSSSGFLGIGAYDQSKYMFQRNNGAVGRVS